MPTIKKIGVLVSILWLILGAPSLTAANAQTAGGRYGFSISPLAGILYGHGEEILYKYPEKNQPVSQLLWDLKPLVYTGLGLEFGPRLSHEHNGFITAASMKYGLPLKTGIMEDRDWLYPDNNKLTNYSRHDAFAQNAILVDLSAGYSWHLKNFLALSAYGEFSFMYISWMAEDGYLQYLDADSNRNIIPGQTWTESIPKVRVYGPGIKYTQYWFILSPGIALKWRINQLFSLKGNFLYSPLIYSAARDDHLRTRYIFWDFLYFGHHIKGGLDFFFSPIKNLDLSLSLSYRYITGPRGKSYWENTSVEMRAPVENTYDGGAGHSALEAGLAARIRIYGRD